MTKQQKLKAERRACKNRVKQFCYFSSINQRDIAQQLEISEQELYNMLSGFQETVRGLDFETMWSKIISYCGKDI